MTYQYLRPDHLAGLEHLLEPPQVVTYLLMRVLAGQLGDDDTERPAGGEEAISTRISVPRPPGTVRTALAEHLAVPG